MIDGAVLVTTPQEIALIDARRAAMFGKTATPILGLIEHGLLRRPVDGRADPDLRSRRRAGGEAKTLGVPVLAQVPIEIARLREAGDAGTPVVLRAPGSGGQGVRGRGQGAVGQVEGLRTRKRPPGFPADGLFVSLREA